MDEDTVRITYIGIWYWNGQVRGREGPPTDKERSSRIRLNRTASPVLRHCCILKTCLYHIPYGRSDAIDVHTLLLGSHSQSV